ncbi:MAG: heparin lyase I family protein [Chitinophagaceae bacterium]
MSCKKDDSSLDEYRYSRSLSLRRGLPTVNAGSDLKLTTSSTTLDGSATKNAVSYSWSKDSGPNATITTPTANQTTVTNLSIGEYRFKLTATNSNGSSTDTIHVSVTSITGTGTGTVGTGTGTTGTGTATTGGNTTAGAGTIPVTGGTSFLGSWAKQYGGWATPNFDNSAIVVDGTDWHGIPAARVQVTSTDKHACGGDCERSEIAELPDGKGGLIDEANALGSTVYFATSYKIPSQFKSTPSNWELVLQLHGPNELSSNPVFAFDIGSKKWQVNMRQGDITSSSNKGYSLTNNSINYDKWTDFIIGINFQKSATGSVTVWRRDEGATTFTKVLDLTGISTLQYSGANGALMYHYWKQGLYRGHLDNTDQIWIGSFVRGTTFSAVENAAFKTQAGAN